MIQAFRHRWQGVLAVVILTLSWPLSSLLAAPRPPSVEVTVVKSHAAPGESVQLAVAVRAPETPGDAAVRVDLPADLATPVVRDGGAACAVAGPTITCTLPVGPNQPALVTVEAHVAPTAVPGTAVWIDATVAVAGTQASGTARLMIDGPPVPTAPPSPAPSIPPTSTPRTDDSGGDPPPTAAPVLPSPTMTPAPAQSLLGDRYENNYDAAHATPLLPTVPLTMTLVSPLGMARGDVDYVTWFVSAGRCWTLETAAVAVGVDTNIELVTADDTVIAGNDDADATTSASRLAQCAATDQVLIARIAQSTHAPLPLISDRTYTVLLTLTVATTATPAPLPPTPIPTVAPPRAAADPPAGASAGGSGTVLPGAPPAPDPTEPGSRTLGPPQAMVCDPLVTTTVAITESAIVAGIEPCEATATIGDALIPTGLAHVAVADAALYHGPGAQYARLAILPRDYTVTLTGPTRNGWVAVALTHQTGMPPLIGWLWGPYLIVDQWTDGSPIPLVAPAPTTTPAIPPVSGNPGPSATAAPVAALGVPQAFTVHDAPTALVTLVVCRQTTTTSDGPCLPQTGIATVPLEVVAANGDVVARGWTDGTGRWVTRLPRHAGPLTVAAPALGLRRAIPMTEDHPIVPLIVPVVVIPPTFR